MRDDDRNRIFESKVNDFLLLSDCLSASLTEWGNGEGVSVWIDTPKKASSPNAKIKDLNFDLSWEQLDALAGLIKHVRKEAQ